MLWNENMDEAPRDKEEILLSNGAMVAPAKFLNGKWTAPGYAGNNVEFHPTKWMLLPEA